jgi:hypothetical protein
MNLMLLAVTVTVKEFQKYINVPGFFHGSTLYGANDFKAKRISSFV